MKAVILAAGKGERMQPLTHTRTKMLLPVAGKPVLEYVLSSLKGTEINDVTLVVGHRKEDLIDRFGDGEELGLNLNYVEQPEQKGTAHAISYTESEESFVVINGDVYCDTASLIDTIKKHEEGDAVATIGTYRVKSAASYGVVRVEDGQVVELVEKPGETSDQLINAGIYVFEPEIYGAIKETPYSERGEKEITTSIENLIEDEKLVLANELGSWVHVGRPWDLLAANEHALENQTPSVNGNIESNAQIGDNVTIGKGTKVKSGSYIEGPAYIGEDCEIGPNCYVRPYTSIGDRVHIGNAVEIKNSIVMKGTHAAHHSYVGDSIVGANCNFGSGTKVGNLRLDAGNIMMTLRGKLVDTGRRKLGAVLGDEVQTGINSMINPGVKMGPQSAIGPGVVLYRDLGPNRCVLVKQEEEERAWRE
ncbi:MAG: NTP transferase domain-containing protein [Hadesarchaea archaeon]|nr:NTP transferase domain-containing protein [Hadesarchaea archaeon]